MKSDINHLKQNATIDTPHRTLVYVLGELRASAQTWESFETNVLQSLNADLAVNRSTSRNADLNSAYEANATYVFDFPNLSDLSSVFDSEQKELLLTIN
jgi:anti-sigma-K factor RskA